MVISSSVSPSPPSPPRFTTVAPFTKFRIQGRPGRKDFDAYVFGNHNAPGIVVLHDSLGVDDHVKNHALRISQLGNGFKVLIPDLYGEYEGQFNGVDTTTGVYSAILWLRANGSDKVGVTGFSKGAALAIYSSYFRPSVDAVVAFYGTPPCMLGIPQCPVQAHFGELDDHAGFSDVETVEKLKDSMVKSAFTCKVFTYPGESHGFMNESPEGMKMQNQDAVQLAWSHFESWMTEYLYS